MPSRTSLPKVCVALGFPTAAEFLDHARREIANGELFFEFRLDYLPEPAAGIQCIRILRQEHPGVSILATCRRDGNHGHFRGTIEEQLRILSDAIDAGASAIDVEIESAELAIPAVLAFRERTVLVVSYHHFESTPAMHSVLKRMSKVDADIWKIVATARKPTDILRVLTCGRALKTKVILLSMGEIGLPSRVLAPSFGSAWTYVSPNSAPGTAPGQITSKQMRNLYRVEKLSRTAKVYGVIADPVKHSMSPQIHNRALQAKRIEAVYLPFRVPPAALRDFVDLAVRLPVAGFSVTIPHKQKIVRYLDHIDPIARRIGAVNTVWRRAGRWRGTNTDVAGILQPLGKRIKIPKSKILIAGNGGAARGAAFALTDAGAHVSIVGRTTEKVRGLARLTGAEALSMDALKGRHFDAVVHATPVGMYPHGDACFFPDEVPADLVFDMVYNPLETELLKRAKAQGSKTIAGIEMFVEQAAHQFELWTGEEAPRKLMEKTVLEALTPVS